MTAPADATSMSSTSSRKLSARSAASALTTFRRRHPLLWRLCATVVLTAVALVIADHVSANTDYDLLLAAVMSIVILGLSFLTGFSGQVSLGNGAFMAVGSYAVGIWGTHHTQTPIVVSLLIATAAGAVVGLLVGLPATRLHGPYLAGLTIALALALPDLVNEFSNWTGGGQGISLNQINAPGWLISYVGGNTPFANQLWETSIAIVTAGVAFLLMANLFRSRTGRGMRMMRENDVAAELAGVSLPRARVLAFSVSSAYAALGGGLLTLMTPLTSSTYSFALSIQILTLLVIGGIGTLSGAHIGGILYAYANQWILSLVSTAGLNQNSNLGTSLNGIVFGGLLVVFVLALPLGIAGTPRYVAMRWWRRRLARTAQAPAAQ